MASKSRGEKEPDNGNGSKILPSEDDIRKFEELDKVEDEEESRMSKKLTTLHVSNSPHLSFFTELVDQLIPTDEIDVGNPKVLIMHGKEEREQATMLCQALCKHERYACRAITLSEIQPILLVRPYDFKKAAFDWADVVMLFFDKEWSSDIESTDPSQMDFRGLERKYEFTLLQEIFVKNASFNLKCIPIDMSDTVTCEIPELGRSLKISDVDGIAKSARIFYDSAKAFVLQQREQNK